VEQWDSWGNGGGGIRTAEAFASLVFKTRAHQPLDTLQNSHWSPYTRPAGSPSFPCPSHSKRASQGLKSTNAMPCFSVQPILMGEGGRAMVVAAGHSLS